MNKLLLTILFFPSLLLAQLNVSQNAVLTTGNDLVLGTDGAVINNGEVIFGTGGQLFLYGDLTLELPSALAVPSLNIINGGKKEIITGKLIVANQLNLLSGIVVVGNESKMVINDGVQIDEFDGVSWIAGSMTHLGNGLKLFPLGANGTYTPIELINVKGTGDISTTMSVRVGGVSLDKLPTNVTTASNNWAWDFTSTNFSSSEVNIPILAEDKALFADGRTIGTVLEYDELSGAVKNLGGVSSSVTSFNSIISNDELIGDRRVLLLGAELSLTPRIHNILTPNDDGFNDYLVIDAIGAYENDNEVIILDRWGSEVYRKQNFRNFNDTDNTYDGSFDRLSPGNYICIFKYAGVTAKQMITVLN
ncbi:gliding motility-associated C-terminal domain-containing protein [Fulvivirga lutimaris]|uniref:T9SS type B sorting domain-containing protein n=1 Tax=Fulvivirga lutimaris TaxID=1819566 RepID=UPI0012BC88AF|nr:gliding motility-associated C-terminal domain-containing protein [Fulvivirga lutimaris]MTI39575.1 hypothetical protein [Fulvivirga lutimaris]